MLDNCQLQNFGLLSPFLRNLKTDLVFCLLGNHTNEHGKSLKHKVALVIKVASSVRLFRINLKMSK